MNEVIIKRGREKSILNRHPWIFSGSVSRINGNPDSGETVKILDYRKEFLAWGAFSPSSQIRLRVWDWDERTQINSEFFYNRLLSSYKYRKKISKLINATGDTAHRLVYAESDDIPGLIVDLYSEILVVQFLSAGVEYWKEEIVSSLTEITGINAVVERSDVDVRKLEGLHSRTGIIRGTFEEGNVIIQENDLKFFVDVNKGHKTGFYLDQKENRKIVRSIAQEKRVLDCFCYTGGFTCSAAAGGAKSITSVDASEEGLSWVNKNLIVNNLGNLDCTLIREDVFKQLRKFRDSGQAFDLIILDPPKFAQSASQIEHASRGYKDINLLALKLLRPGGLLATFSCSGAISEDLFQKIVTGAALDANVKTRILKRLSQNYDHPISLTFPEGAYLKGLLIAVD